MQLKTTNIKGKEYVAVNERIRAFRSSEVFKGYSLRTILCREDEKEVVMEAQIFNKEGVMVANGHAHEVRGSTNVNKTSHIENCETSAWGRALGNLGIGVDTSIASYEEVENAIKKQEALDNDLTEKGISKQDYLLELISQTGVEITENIENAVDGYSETELNKHIKAYENKLNG